MQQRLLSHGLVAATLAIISLLTLTPTSAEPGQTEVWCLACGHLGGRDFVLNIVLFVPVGFALGLAGVRRRVALPLMAAVTLAIELLQMHVVAGRDASLGDLIANWAGGGVGYVVGTHRGPLLRPPAALARRLALAAAACAVSVFLATAWGVQPSLPRTRYYAQWAADMSNFGHFTGSIVAGRAGTEPFPPIGEIERSDRFRDRLLDGPAALSAVVLPSPSQEPQLSPILSVFDQRRREIVLLGQEEHDLVFRMRTRSTDARFPIVGVRLPDVFAHRLRGGALAAETTFVAGGLSNGNFWLSAADGGATRRAGYALGPELGWFFLLPWQYKLNGWSGVLSALWVTGLLLPLAYWSSVSARTAAVPGQRAQGWLALPLAVTVLSLGVLPMLLGYQSAGWAAWVAGVVAGMGGWVLAAGSEHQTRQR
jgi:VanZ family protein